MLRALIGLLAVFGAASLAQAQQSGPAPITQYETPAEARWAIFSSDLPACDNPSVLSIITGRFSEAENTYWGGQSAIGAFDRVKEIGFRSNGLAYIPRRYCVARAMMDDPRAAPPIERKPDHRHLRRHRRRRHHRLHLGRRVVRGRLRPRARL